MLKETVFNELKQAMRDKDSLKKGVLTLVKSAIDLEAKEQGAALNEAQEIAIIEREVKQTKQALEGAEQAGREDLIANEKRKLEILQNFLPKQLTDEEAEVLLAEAGITQGMNMGDAMKIAKPLLAGKVDGKRMAMLVKSLL